MLKAYKQKYKKSKIQYLIVNENGEILESDDGLFSDIQFKKLQDLHPFFESLIGLFTTPNEDYFFSCVHLNINNVKFIADINLKTFDGDLNPLVIIQDLTSHYNNYQSTAQIRNESVITSQILELENNYLQEKEEFKNRFIANFSHEIREPLSGIITFAEILNKSGINSEQKGYVDLIQSSSNHLKSLIDNILDISKIEAGKLALELQPFSLITLLNEIKSVYQVRAQNKGLEFVTNFNANIPEILEGDPLRLRQIISCLLDNAIKFTPQGTITFNVSLNQVRAQKASVFFEIEDTGVGLEPDQFDLIFDSFYKYNHKNITNSGSGIGLAVVKRLLSLSKNTVKLESEVGKGSRFYTSINFKLKKEKKKLKKKLNKEITADPNKKYNILLVEDSAISQLSVLKILASKGNFFLDIVTKPEDVLFKIQNQEFDLVLMDIKIDEYDGEDITRQIRTLPEREHRKIPVLAFTASVFKEDIRRYKKAGMNGVIQKPFDEDTLINTIYKHLK